MNTRVNLIRFIYCIYNYRLLYYIPMERMKQDIKYVSIGIYKQLEEENKNLTKCNLNLQEWLDNKEKVNKSLREENKKLNIKVASLEWEIKWLNYTIEKLKEENQTLELWLDNKEKLNEKYRKELEELKSTYVYDAKQVRDIC